MGFRARGVGVEEAGLSVAAALAVLPGAALGARAPQSSTRMRSAALPRVPSQARPGSRFGFCFPWCAPVAPPRAGGCSRDGSATRRIVGSFDRDVAAACELQRHVQPRQRGDQLQPGIRATRSGPLRREWVRSGHGQLGVHGLQVRRRGRQWAFNVNGPFDEGLTEFTSDPRCYYDPTTNTWFATILFISGGDFGSSFGETSHLDIAVNSQNGPTVNGNPGDPTNPWIVYQIDTTDPGGNGCPCFGDQPRLGFDSQNIYVTDDEFSINGPEFNGGEIYAFSKKDLVALNPTVHFAHFPHLSVGGMTPLAPQPALTTGNSPAEYFLGSLDPNGTFDQRLAVWALTNTGAASSGGKPTLSSLVVNSEAYGVPPGAQQMGATSLLDSGDDRMQQTQFIKGNLWGELTTAVTIPGDSTERAGAAWFDVQPHLTGGTLDSKTKMHQQGYVAVQGRYFIYPALQVAPDGGAVMGGAVSGSDLFPSAAFTTLTPASNAFGPVQIAARGSTNYDPGSTRWGDYSWAVLDPSGNSVWLATEYVPPISSQTPDGIRNWGTRVMNVSAP